jgi:hypothetical protein
MCYLVESSNTKRQKTNHKHQLIKKALAKAKAV